MSEPQADYVSVDWESYRLKPYGVVTAIHRLVSRDRDIAGVPLTDAMLQKELDRMVLWLNNGQRFRVIVEEVKE